MLTGTASITTNKITHRIAIPTARSNISSFIVFCDARTDSRTTMKTVTAIPRRSINVANNAIEQRMKIIGRIFQRSTGTISPVKLLTARKIPNAINAPDITSGNQPGPMRRMVPNASLQPKISPADPKATSDRP